MRARELKAWINQLPDSARLVVKTSEYKHYGTDVEYRELTPGSFQAVMHPDDLRAMETEDAIAAGKQVPE